MLEHSDSSSYSTEAADTYQRLMSDLRGEDRRLWVEFVEDTANHALRSCPPLAVGEPFPRFEELRVQIDGLLGQSSSPEPRWYVIAFSFGASYPFCRLAFAHVSVIGEELRRHRAAFACLFPPEDPPSKSVDHGLALIVDQNGKWSAECGFRMELAPRFHALANRIPWFLPLLGQGNGDRITLPGTVIVSKAGVVRDFHLPSDVTRRLAPSDLLDRLRNLETESR